jgi:hypothetical protein
MDPTIQLRNSGKVLKQVEAWGRILYLSMETEWSLTYKNDGYMKRISKVAAGLLKSALLDGGPASLGMDDMGDAAWALMSYFHEYSNLEQEYKISDEWRQFAELYYDAFRRMTITDSNEA